MKKAISIVLVLAIACSFAVLLASCNPDTIENVVGTYKMSVNTTGNEEYDLITANGIEAYIVVSGNETGYFVYKDVSTPLTVKEVALEYIQNNNQKVTQIGITDKQGWVETRVGCVQKLFVDKTSDGMELKYDQRPFGDVVKKKKTVYERVDKSTDLSYLNGVYGASLPDVVANDEKSMLHGVWDAYEDRGEYAFRYLDFDVLTSKVTEYCVKDGESEITRNVYDFVAGSAHTDETTGDTTVAVTIETKDGNVEYELYVPQNGRYHLRKLPLPADSENYISCYFETSLSRLNVEACILSMLD